MSVTTDYSNCSLGSDAPTWVRGLQISPNTSFRKVWNSNKSEDLVPSTLQGRITTPKTVTLPPLLAPDASIDDIELVLIEWEEKAVKGENREGAKDAIMNFLWDSSLKNLQLVSYKLKTLPNIWNVRMIAERLTLLNLSDNQLKYLPSTFGDLESLEYLSLQNNCLVDPPKEISNFKFLKWLNISHNPTLKSIPALRVGCSIQIGEGNLGRDEVNRLGKFYTVYTK
jgi:hypothetical protein